MSGQTIRFPKGVARPEKSYAQIRAEYEVKLSQIQKERLDAAKQRRKERIKKGIRIEFEKEPKNPWVSPINPLKDS